jgi:hypothetical protein
MKPWPTVSRGTLDEHVDPDTGAVNRSRWWVRECDPHAEAVTYRLCVRIIYGKGPPAVMFASRTFNLEQLERGVIPDVRAAIADQLRKMRRELGADIALARVNLGKYDAPRFAT